MISSTSSSFSLCVFCYKSTLTPHHSSDHYRKDGTGISGNNTSVVVLVKRFLTLLERFSDTYGRGKENIPDFKWSRWLSCCQECHCLVDEFCTLHHQMKLLELQLDRRLERFASSMELAGRIPTRWTRLQQLLEDHIPKYACEGTNVNFLSNIRRFRQNIIRKCSIRRSKSQPRVLMTPIPENYSARPSEQDMSHNFEDESTSDYCESSPVHLQESVCPSAPSESDSLPPPASIEKKNVDHIPQEKSKTVTTTRHVIIVKVESQENGENYQDLSSELNNFGGNETSVQIKPEDYQDASDSCADNNNDDNDVSQQSDTEGSDAVQTSKDVWRSIIHCKDNTFGCPECDKKFAKKKTAYNHARNVHSKETHKCSLCDKVFKTTESLKYHRITHIGRSCYKFKCPKCGKAFRSNSSLVHHLGRVHNEAAPMPCQNCDSVFFTKESLDKHIRVVHSGRSYKCDKCGKVLTTSGKLKEHAAYVHSNTKRTFKCAQCGEVFRSRLSLSKHSMVHNGPSAYKFQCTLCEYRCILKTSLDIHMRRHEEKKFVCKICSCKCSSASDLSSHVTCEHIEKGDMDSDKIFRCAQCGAVFLKKQYLTKHNRNVHGIGVDIGSHKCPSPKCKKIFTTRLKLKQHSVIHQDPSTWKHSCSECGKRFYFKMNLSRHLIMHKNKKSPV